MDVTNGGQGVSTLMDGELDVDAAAREIARLKSDGALREHWDTYHLIGDAIRGSDAASGAHGFTQRFSERLALEPTVLAPAPSRVTRKVQTYALSAAASVAAVVVVGWAALNMLKPAVPGGELAAAPPAATTLAAAPSKPASVGPVASVAPPPETVAVLPVAAPAEHVQEYLLAHQGISPTTAIQGVTPYIRTVSGTGE